MYKPWSAAAAVLIVAASFASGRGLNLKRQAKAGDIALYHIDASFKYGERTATMSMDQREKTTSVDPDGTYQVQVSGENCKMVVDAKVQSLADSANVSSVYDSLGQLVKTDASDDSNAYRKANMISVVAPSKAVTVGESWTREVKGDESRAVKAATSSFEVLSLEKYEGLNAAKVKFSYKETEGYDPISSEGIAYVDVTTGFVIDLKASFKNYPMGPAGTPVEGTLQMKKQVS